MKKYIVVLAYLLIGTFFSNAQQSKQPNVILIYVDDLGYGDLSINGATKIQTPKIDELGKQGIQFLNAHSTAATCTPSRYSLMTGKYPFRQSGTNILPGDAKLIISANDLTLPKVFQQAGYETALIGKWHLGLGNTVEKDWNGELKPGPLEVGYNYSFIFPATADRVPTVFVENHRVVNTKASDPIQVSYREKIGNESTGMENPALLKMKSSPNHGHNNTIVNGIGRIGWMSGGTEARWTDEELSYTFVDKVNSYIETHKDKPFFLCYNATEPHVPRMPSTQFKGKSGLGYRGDAILQLDHSVGEITNKLKSLGLYENTIIIFSSDNGPVLDDGYEDGAVSELNSHDPFGGMRGGKYSAFEAGSRIPFLLSWPKEIKKATQSNALIGQQDLLASFASFLKVNIPKEQAIDSKNLFNALIGKDKIGRDYLVKSAGTFSIIQGNFKYIRPSKGAKIARLTNIELGNNPDEQLYDLSNDRHEDQNIAGKYPEKVNELKALLQHELQRK